MKTKRFLSGLLCAVLVFALLPAGAPTALAAAPDWTAVGGPGFSAGPVFYTSLALDSSGTPYAAYQDGSGLKATVMKYTGAGWERVGSAGFSDGMTDYISLALAGTTPYVAYQDWSIAGKNATVMKYSGDVTGWETVGSPGFSAGRANDVSLAIDSGGTPYVAYGDGSNGFRATVMKYSGDVTGWETVGLSGFSAGEAKHISLAIDSEGTPYVAYRDDGTGNKASVMKYTGAGPTGWVEVGSPGFSDGVAECTSLAFDNAGTPYVAYQDYGTGGKATVMKYTGVGSTGWETVGSPGFSAGEATDMSLVIGSAGTPYVAYQDYGTGGKATVMKYTGVGSTGWEAVGSPGFSAGYAAYTSMAIGSGGALYVAYQDGGSSQKATVMRYIPDVAAPVLTAGGVSRSSDSAAEVSFTSSEEGRYYSAVVAAGAAAPILDTSGAGTACAAGIQTITLTGLSAGGRDIYIKVKDDSGNVSGALSINIPPCWRESRP